MRTMGHHREQPFAKVLDSRANNYSNGMARIIDYSVCVYLYGSTYIICDRMRMFCFGYFE